MKVICNRGALLEALLLTGNVIAARTPKPVLQCVKLTAENNSLTIASTDLEVSIRYMDNQVQVEEPGEVLMPADRLLAIVRESAEDTLAIEVNGESATIRGQDSLFKVFTQPASDFPVVPGFEGTVDFKIAGGQLKQYIGQTLFAAAKEPSRFAFNGVLLSVMGKKINLVSTDGRRLAQAKGELAEAVTSRGEKQAKEKELRAIVPAKALQLMEKLIDDPEELVGFQIEENKIVVHTSNATLTSNLLEGQFPPYEDVIPKDCDRKMTAATADFLSAVKRSALLAADDSKGVRLAFTKKGLVVNGRSQEAGEATVDFPCKFEGADIEIGFNPAFLVEGLRVVDTEEVTLELTAPNRPGLVRAGANFLYVIMPVSLS